MPKVTPDSALIVAGNASGIKYVTRVREERTNLELKENGGDPLFEDDDNELYRMIKVSIDLN